MMIMLFSRYDSDSVIVLVIGFMVLGSVCVSIMCIGEVFFRCIILMYGVLSWLMMVVWFICIICVMIM